MDRDSRPIRAYGGGGYNFSEENANPFGTTKRGVPSDVPAFGGGGASSNGSTLHAEAAAAAAAVAKALADAAAKPKAPRNVERPLKYNPTGAYDRVPDEFKDEAYFASTLSGGNGETLAMTINGEGGCNGEFNDTMVLVPCPNCGRKFKEDRLEKHAAACRSLSDGKARRGAFNTTTSSNMTSPSLNSSHMGSSMRSVGSTSGVSPTKSSGYGYGRSPGAASNGASPGGASSTTNRPVGSSTLRSSPAASPGARPTVSGAARR